MGLRMTDSDYFPPWDSEGAESHSEIGGLMPHHELRHALEHYRTHWERFLGIAASHCPDHLTPELWGWVKEVYDEAARHSRNALEFAGTQSTGVNELSPPALKPYGIAEADRVEWLRWLEDVACEVMGGRDGSSVTESALFEQFAQMQWADVMLEELATVGKRMDILARVRPLSVPEKARPYVSHVVDCFLRGMDREMAVMARVALEAALRNAQGSDGQDGWAIHVALSALRSLDPAVCDAARRVKGAGDAGAHSFEEFEVDAESVLADLAKVLRWLGTAPARRLPRHESAS